MPANLNALIRYKTINSCLYGGTRRWSINELIDACSNALSESRGRYGRISERTIRDDIRVMRSEILGFNAPIKQIAGLYFYGDPHYSIMSIGITDAVLVEKIIKLLLEVRSEVKHPELEIILNKLMGMLPDRLLQEEKQDIILSKTYYQRRFNFEEGEKAKKIRVPKKATDKPEPAASEPYSEPDFGPPVSFSLSPSPFPSLSWGDVLGAIK
jgi:hypothetical protein